MTVKVPMFYRVVGTEPPLFSFPKYFPTDPNVHQRKIFESTNFVASSSVVMTNEILGFKSVPYTSGSIVGVTNSEGWIYYNSGTEVMMLGFDDAILSTDTNLAAHPDCWSFGAVYDEMTISQSFHIVSEDLSWSESNEQKIFVQIDDVTIPSGIYSNAIIFWHLDLDKPYASLNFHGEDVIMGIELPDSEQTGGYSVTDFEIYAQTIGTIVAGDVEGISGNLNDIKKLQEVLDP